VVSEERADTEVGTSVDRTYAEAGPHALGAAIANVYLGMLSQGLDETTAFELTKEWLWVQFAKGPGE